MTLDLASHWIMRGAILGAMTSLMVACSTMPAFGPSAESISKSALSTDTSSDETVVFPYQVVEVSAATLPVQINTKNHFSSAFRAQRLRTEDETINVGDQLQIRIWEVAEDGLFASAGQRETQLSVTVSNSGNISAPYAGTMQANGITTAELRSILLDRYRGRAVEPEIAVSITRTDGRAVAVLGTVGAPGRINIPPNGLRLLDVIARTGGVSFAEWEVVVSVQRGANRSSAELSDIISSPSNNIVILPNDTVTVSYAPRRFAIYGAVNRSGNIEIATENASLAYLIAEARGLNDQVAEARSVFVFRPTYESSNGSQATAYRLDFSRPDALLLAQQFNLEPTDITYVASSDAADLQRFISLLLSPLLSTASGAASLGN